MSSFRTSILIAVSTVAVMGTIVVAGALRAPEAQTTSVRQLSVFTHIHGLAVDRADPTLLLIATHHGLYRAGPDGSAELISVVQDFMGFTPHPSDPDRLFASGHPATGGNLGFIASTDRGRTWTRVAQGLFGPVDFHQTVSPADPATIYGAFIGLQMSRNSGVRWEVAGQLPNGLIDLAASAIDADTIYAATQSGLLVSSDAGKSWRPVLESAAVSLVEVTPDGKLYAFALDRGLVQSPEAPLAFEQLGAIRGIPLHLAIDPSDPLKLYVATEDGDVLASADGGRS